MIIDSFWNQYRFLSNFYLSIIQFDGVFYPTVEHAYVAAKTTDSDLREQILQIPNPRDVKSFGRNLDLRPGWDTLRDHYMYLFVSRKFNIPGLRKNLIATGDAMLIEGNTWGDTYWGVCNGIGENKLGKILMLVRRDINHEVNYADRVY